MPFEALTLKVLFMNFRRSFICLLFGMALALSETSWRSWEGGEEGGRRQPLDREAREEENRFAACQSSLVLTWTSLHSAAVLMSPFFLMISRSSLVGSAGSSRRRAKGVQGAQRSSVHDRWRAAPFGPKPLGNRKQWGGCVL